LLPKVYDTERIPILLKELLAFVTNPFERCAANLKKVFHGKHVWDSENTNKASAGMFLCRGTSALTH
jgi:hypothetical protein